VLRVQLTLSQSNLISADSSGAHGRKKSFSTARPLLLCGADSTINDGVDDQDPFAKYHHGPN
jgi:hypothetical protein